MRLYTSFGSVYSLVQRGAITEGSQIPARLRDAGLDGLEINANVLDLKDRLLPEFSFSLQDLDGLPLSLHSDYVDFNAASINPFARRAAIEQLVSEIDLCDSRGIPILTIHPGFVRKVDRQLALEFFWDSLSQAWASRGSSRVTICLENMDHRQEKLCNTADEIRMTLQRFPRLRLTADLAHLGLAEMDIAAFIDDFSDRIAHLHVSGVVPGQPHGSISLAASSIDFRPYLRPFGSRDITAVIENQPWEIMIESRDVLNGLR